ncbi:MAG: MarR family transcriptional regulator [Rhodocyclaceae bacterium]|nr:MarR family transcriptional regulator [Rhodocyclaceae bacterium]
MRGIERLAAVKRSTPAMAAALPDLPMPETVMIRLLRISAYGLGTYFEPVFRRLGLTENSFHVLCLLVAAEEGSASPSELSELVGTSRANMTRILDALVSEGLVSRTIETRDGRRHVIKITRAGLKAANDAVPKMIEPLKRAFSDLSPEEFAVMEKLLRKTITSFDKGAQPLKAIA